MENEAAKRIFAEFKDTKDIRSVPVGYMNVMELFRLYLIVGGMPAYCASEPTMPWLRFVLLQ